MNYPTKGTWFLVIFGVLVGAGIIAAVITDLILFMKDKETISQYLLINSRRYPFMPAIIGMVVGLILGVLIGHLWFPQSSRWE